jgi:hypothetical protein
MNSTEMSLRCASASKVVELSSLKKGNIILVSKKDSKSPTGWSCERATVEEEDPTGSTLLIRCDNTPGIPQFLMPDENCIVVLMA